MPPLRSSFPVIHYAWSFRSSSLRPPSLQEPAPFLPSNPDLHFDTLRNLPWLRPTCQSVAIFRSLRLPKNLHSPPFTAFQELSVRLPGLCHDLSHRIQRPNPERPLIDHKRKAMRVTNASRERSEGGFFVYKRLLGSKGTLRGLPRLCVSRQRIHWGCLVWLWVRLLKDPGGGLEMRVDGLE